jgi:hypothetical protein
MARSGHTIRHRIALAEYQLAAQAAEQRVDRLTTALTEAAWLATIALAAAAHAHRGSTRATSTRRWTQACLRLQIHARTAISPQPWRYRQCPDSTRQELICGITPSPAAVTS